VVVEITTALLLRVLDRAAAATLLRATNLALVAAVASRHQEKGEAIQAQEAEATSHLLETIAARLVTTAAIARPRTTAMVSLPQMGNRQVGETTATLLPATTTANRHQAKAKVAPAQVAAIASRILMTMKALPAVTTPVGASLDLATAQAMARRILPRATAAARVLRSVLLRFGAR
jgi:cell envelope opacity-associated protein A